MNYASAKEAFEEELSFMGKSISPVVAMHGDPQKVDIEVFTNNVYICKIVVYRVSDLSNNEVLLLVTYCSVLKYH